MSNADWIFITFIALLMALNNYCDRRDVADLKLRLDKIERDVLKKLIGVE